MTDPGQTQHCPGCAEGRPRLTQDRGLKLLQSLQNGASGQVTIPREWQLCTAYGGFHPPEGDGWGDEDTRPAQRPRRRPEQEIRLGIRGLLTAAGFRCWDTEQDRPTRVTAGLSDLIAFGYGATLFIEVKTPQGGLTEAQEAFGDAVAEGQGHYLVWRSVADAEAWLTEAGILSGREE